MKTDFSGVTRFISGKWFLVLCICLAAFLRLWKLGTVPPSLSPDEAALGYNAYSILKTGKDEHGEFLPVIFKSFGDYKPGLYIYSATPFVATLGLTEFAVRLPSAIAGIFIVFLVYRLILQFGQDKTHRHSKTNHLLLANLGALCASVSPWLIYFSRGAWEANLNLALTLAGCLFFLMSFEKMKYLLLSSLFFSLTLWCYQGAKLSTLIVILILLSIFRKEIAEIWKLSIARLFLPVTVGLLITLPVIFSFFQGKAGRLAVFSIFSYPRPQEYTRVFLDQGAENSGSLNYYLFHSESMNFARGILGRWFNHLGSRFLFFEGDYQNARHGSPYHGVMLLVDILLVPMGLLYLIRNNSRLSGFSLFWLVLAPLPAVLSSSEVHAVRAINMAVPLIIISSAGLYYLTQLISRLKLKFIFFSVILLFYSLSFIYFLDSYFIHMPVHNAKAWNFGYKEAFEKVLAVQQNYEKIIFQQSYSQPYIYYLFYTKYDPQKYQKSASLNITTEDVGLVKNIDRIDFEFFGWVPTLDSRKTLLIGDDIAIPGYFYKSNFKLISEIREPDGISAAFRILERE